MTRIILPLDYFLLGATYFPSCDNEGTSANLQNASNLPAPVSPETSINKP